MTEALTIGIMFLIAVFALWRGMRSPAFVAGLLRLTFKAIVKHRISWDAIKARHTPEEWEAIRKKWDESHRSNK